MTRKQTVDLVVDNYKLKGALIFPEKLKEKNPAILFIHGWTSKKERSYQYAKALATLGYISFLFDMRGHGESEGDINTSTPKEFLRDCVAAYDYIATVDGVDEENISIVSSSFGGYLSSMVTTKRKIKHLAMRVPADYANNTFEKPKMGNAGENPKVFEWRLIPKKYTEIFAYKALHNYDGNILIIESEKDDVVPHQSIQNYIDAVKDKRQLTHIVVKNAPHSIKEGPFKNEVERILIRWFKK